MSNLKELCSLTDLMSVIAMSQKDIDTVKSFCEKSKMTFNEKVDNYDFDAHKSNVRLCNFGKSDVCRTASIWYAPKRYNDFGVRIEATTLNNYRKSDINAFLLDNVYHGVESRENGKDNEYRYSFVSLESALSFFSTLQDNYRKMIATKEATKEAIATKEA